MLIKIIPKQALPFKPSRADAKSTASYFLGPTFLGLPIKAQQMGINMFEIIFKKINICIELTKMCF